MHSDAVLQAQGEVINHGLHRCKGRRAGSMAGCSLPQQLGGEPELLEVMLVRFPVNLLGEALDFCTHIFFDNPDSYLTLV